MRRAPRQRCSQSSVPDSYYSPPSAAKDHLPAKSSDAAEQNGDIKTAAGVLSRPLLYVRFNKPPGRFSDSRFTTSLVFYANIFNKQHPVIALPQNTEEPLRRAKPVSTIISVAVVHANTKNVLCIHTIGQDFLCRQRECASSNTQRRRHTQRARVNTNFCTYHTPPHSNAALLSLPLFSQIVGDSPLYSERFI